MAFFSADPQEETRHPTIADWSIASPRIHQEPGSWIFPSRRSNLHAPDHRRFGVSLEER